MEAGGPASGMSQFEYVAVLISFAAALGVAELVGGWARLLRHRREVRFDWLHAGATGLALLLLTQFWWGFWNFRHVQHWSYPMLLVVLASVVAIVMAALVVTPGEVEGGLDLRAHYMEQRGVLYALAALALLLFGLSDAMIIGEPPLHPENAYRVAGVALCGVAAGSGNPRVHAALLGLAYLLIAGFLGIAIES